MHKYIMNAHVFMWRLPNPTLEINELFWNSACSQNKPIRKRWKWISAQVKWKVHELCQICSESFIDGFKTKPPIMDWGMKQKKIQWKSQIHIKRSNDPSLNALICQCAECCDAIKSRPYMDKYLTTESCTFAGK